jgi:hypothetical protein
VAGLNDYRLLKELEDAVGARRTELSTLNGELQESQATLKAVKEHVLGEIEDAQNRSIEQMYKEASAAMKYIKNLRDLNKLSITELKDSSITSLRKVRETHEKELDQSKDALMGYIGQVSSTAQTEIQRATQSLQAKLDAYEGVILKWGEMKEEYGEYKEYFPFARIIHDAINLKDNAGTVPLETMSLIVRYVRIWVDQMAANETIKPILQIAENSKLSTYTDYKVTTFANMLELYFFKDFLPSSR